MGRVIFYSIIHFILALVVMGGLATMIFLDSTQVSSRLIKDLTLTRGQELTELIAGVSGEKFSRKNIVKLSAAMKRVVETSRNKGDYFEIEELALLDRDGRIWAHNEILMVARDSKTMFNEESYSQILNLPRMNPVQIEPLDRIDLKNRYTEFLKSDSELAMYGRLLFAKVEKFMPWLKNTGQRYHIGSAVFLNLTKKNRADGRLHMIVSVRSMDYLLAHHEVMAFKIIKMIPIFAAGFTLIIALFLIWPLVAKIRAREKAEEISDEEESFGIVEEELRAEGIAHFPAADLGADFDAEHYPSEFESYGAENEPAHLSLRSSEGSKRIVDAIALD